MEVLFGRSKIKELIPQREPFLFVSEVYSLDEKKIVTGLTLSGDEDFFKGHFPGMPVMPGVLLEEALFQSAAILLSSGSSDKIGVVTRVSNAKFKSIVRPNSKLLMEVELIERLSNASFLKGKTTVDGKTVLVLEFAVALIDEV